MQRVAIIIPYFGKWPVWMDFYLYTCSRQQNVDFLFFTDCGIPKTVYKNTIFMEIDYSTYCNKISDKLGIDFNNVPPYKLCDCRPFLGIIHEKELSKYEFWGFADIDLIYGNLNYMLNNENLNKYDFISSHSERIAGHLTVIRNIKKYNNACFYIPNWKEKLLLKNLCALDESIYFGMIINPCYKFILSSYYHIFKHIYQRNKYRYFDLAQKITQPFHKKSLFKERYTTPIPKVGQKWKYNLKTGEIIVPHDAWYNMPSDGGKIYLHFLFFKKTIYRKTNFYWKDDFYKIPKNFNFDKETGTIVISTDGIYLETQND